MQDWASAYFVRVRHKSKGLCDVDLKRDQLETRVATLELMLVTARARPKPNEAEIANLERELKVATAALEKYDREHPRK